MMNPDTVPTPVAISRAFRTINPIYILIFFFILLTILKILLTGAIISPQIFEDELCYNNLAKDIYTGVLLFGQDTYSGGPFPPGYAFFISLAFLFTQDTYIAYHYMLIINAIITSSILFPAYFLLKPATSRYVAVSGALLIAMLPSVTMNTFVLMSEVVFIPLYLFSIWFVSRSLSEKNPSFWDILAGVSIFGLLFTRAAGWGSVVALALALIWMMRRDGFRIDKFWIQKVAGIILPILVLYGIWAVDQIVTKGGLPSGYSTTQYLGLLYEVLAQDPLHIPYIILVHIDYIVLASLIIIPLFAFQQVIFRRFHYPPEKQEGKYSRYGISCSPTIIYSGVSALLIFTIGIVHMSNISYELAICGRYMDPIVPLVVLTGITGMYGYLKKQSIRTFLVSGMVYLLILYGLTSLVMLPVAHQPNNNVGIFFLYSLGAEYIVPSLSLVIGLALFLVASLVVWIKKGVIPLILVFIITAAIISVPIYFYVSNVSEKTGSVLPFCQEVNTLCGNSGVIWDKSSEEYEWDRMVYYTMKFWLGDRVNEVETESNVQAKNATWMITKRKVDNPALSYTAFSVIPLNR